MNNSNDDTFIDKPDIYEDTIIEIDMNKFANSQCSSATSTKPPSRYGSNRSHTSTFYELEMDDTNVIFYDDIRNDRRSSVLTLDEIDSWLLQASRERKCHEKETTKMNRLNTFHAKSLPKKLFPLSRTRSLSDMAKENAHIKPKHTLKQYSSQEEGEGGNNNNNNDDDDDDTTQKRRTSTLAKDRDEQQKHYRRKIIQKLNNILEHKIYFSISMMLTTWAIIGIDMRDIFMSKSADYPLQWCSLFIFIFFIIEMLLLVFANPVTYRFQFYFWMDLLATLSMIPEFLGLFGVSQTSMSALTVARVGRVARASARTARFARIVRFFELLTRKKRTKPKNAWLDRNSMDDDEYDINLNEDSTEKLMEPSALRVQVNDVTFQTIFIVVLVLFLGFTFLDPLLFDSSFFQTFSSIELGALQNLYNISPVGNNSGYLEYLNFLKIQHGTRLIETIILNNINGVTIKLINNYERISQLRQHEIFTVNCSLNDICESSFDVKTEAEVAAILSLIITITIIIILICTQLILTQRLQTLIIAPIERMVAVVKLLATNPMTTLNVKRDFRFEAGMVESMLAKIGSLLQIGFGVAGATIIRENLSMSGDLQPIVAGNKVRGVFGFCDIRGFTAATEILQENVMIFVNTIAEIIHEAVVEHGGFPNHNIGDAFLLVWPIPENSTQEQITTITENALRACRVIRQRLRQSIVLSQILNQLDGKLPKYVNMGYGLHLGWAIVGAIGSRRKLDASYLSPHVNLSARLETATKQYGVDILISQAVFEQLSFKTKNSCYLVDRALLKGIASPMKLYAAYPQISLRIRHQAFFDKWHNIVQQYIDGKWIHAKNALNNSKESFFLFQPANVLLRWMSSLSFLPPKDWNGYRSLTNK